MRLNKKENIVFVIVVVILLVGIFVINNQPKETKELPRVKLKEQVKNKQFALMVEKTKGKGDYEDGSATYQDSFPGEGYKLNETKSGCVDINGKIIEGALSYDTGTYAITINTNKTAYCYLYYDIEPNISYLRSKDTDSHISKELTGGMYRYQGLYSDDIRNYICLGDNCCNSESCPADDNDDMYRIIGITQKGDIKVIKKTALTDGVKWWSDSDKDIKWSQSLAYQKLNGKSNDGSANPNLNDTSSYYYNLESNLKDLIVNNHSWLYGDAFHSNGFDYNGNMIFGIESGNSKTTYYNKGDINDSPTGKEIWNERIEAPLGLIYISDYLYAYKTNDEDAGNSEIYSKTKNSWIHTIHNEATHPSGTYGNEWTISRYGYNPVDNVYFAWLVDAFGRVYSDDLYYALALRPSFYLSSSVELMGEGSLTNPFRIPGVG